MRLARLCEFDPNRIRAVEQWLEKVLDVRRDRRNESPPVFVGGYAVGELLGRGAFGVVHRGQRADTHAPVVIKFLDPRREHKAADLKHILDEFWHEAATGRGLAGLGGFPNVIDAGIDPATGWAYLVQDDLPGETLDTWASRRPTLSDVVRVMADACAIVSRMHAFGVSHRDLKPQNLLVTPDGRVHVLDLGLAVREDGKRSATGRRDGTRRYMAPEQARGNFHRTRSDQYSLGLILAELLAPHGIQPALAQVVRVATQPDPSDRHPTVADMEAALRGWVEDCALTPRLVLTETVCPLHRGEPVQLAPARTKAEAENLLHRFGPKLPDFDYSAIPKSEHDLTIPLQVTEQLARWEVRTVTAARFFVRVAHHLIGQGHLRLPALLYTWATDITHGATSRADRLERATWLDEYGTLQWSYGQTDRGLEAAREVYKIRLEMLGQDDELTNQALNNLAEAYRRVGEHRVAARMHKDSFETARRLQPEGNEFAWRCGNWGNMLTRQGRVDEARHVIEQGVRIKSRVLAPNHPQVCFLLNHLAEALDTAATDSHAQAVKTFELSRRFRERAFGEDGFPALHVRNLQIESHMSHGEWEAAEKLAGFFTELPFAIDREALARGLENYLAICRKLKRSDWRAAEFQGRALAIRAFIRG
jgi:serine/threonine protein kinase